ncbi:MAG: hypothetical protein ACI94Y_002111 [Maribacter sp.]|jgi:hypothetical protein
MKLSAFKEIVKTLEKLNFELPNGELVPSHYHVTEVGYITKNFIDCGGTIREEKVVNFQLWYSDDVDHSLLPQNFLDIVTLSENKLGIGDFDIEVEYQSNTIGKYGLEFNGNNFVLATKMTDCLAKDNCGIPVVKTKVNLSDLMVTNNSCTPGGGCC